ncbi:MAG: asparagine--tRNA ligase [Crocinitomicaceae bacterium]|nr:asparagine--tRNA ligase [Crocinitomicaceae bacterium]|tara:strand:- start:173 stop:1591 length:1419 start_codon:yes stop_codon:yes gene_type:complete
MERTKIYKALKASSGEKITVCGWVRSFRANRFIALNDGSCLSSLQVVIDFENTEQQLLDTISVGASISVSGEMVESQGSGQKIELQAHTINVIGTANPEEVQKTILQPKKHNLETLREQAHLRFRTNLFGAVFRIRHHMSFAVHNYFNQKGYFYIHTPIITGSDAEGAGEMFKVTTVDNAQKKYNPEEDFFGKQTHLTVSGQLEAELAALALSQVYTFGPTFRAENSNTTRHLAEFWMIEPEIAFADLKDNIDLAEDFLKYLVNYALTNCMEDLLFLNERDEKEDLQRPKNLRSELNLIDRLRFVVDNEFIKITYSEAIDILINSKPNKKKKFKYLVEWGIDLQSEHEKYLVEKHFKKPVVIFDYPKGVKAFYMRENSDDKTVAAMDVLFPGIGEIVGGSQREERHDVLLKKCKEFGIPQEHVWWYLETRKFGTVPHAGFGLGFERLIMFVTGMQNIRDVIPFPRTPKNAEF